MDVGPGRGAGAQDACHVAVPVVGATPPRAPWGARRDILAGRWRPWYADILLAPLLTFPF